MIEIYFYQKGYIKGFELKESEKENKGRLGGEKSLNYALHREQVLKRAKTNLRRQINSNHGQYGKELTSKFVTLTYRNHVTDFVTANKDFLLFIKRLNYKVFNVKKAILAYTCVPEFTKIGRIHFHVIFYNLPFIKASDLADVWGKGFVKINSIDDVDNVGAYVSSYLTKVDDERLQGKKSYFSSRGLLKPLEVTNKNEVIKIWASLPQGSENYNASYETEQFGRIDYIQYNLNSK